MIDLTLTSEQVDAYQAIENLARAYGIGQGKLMEFRLKFKLDDEGLLAFETYLGEPK